MAKEEKKSVALEFSVYVNLSKLAADLRAANPGGGFVSMSTAVERLLNLWYEKSNSVSLQAYAADAEKNDPQYLEEKPSRVVIRSKAASSMYLEKAYSFDNLFDLTNNKEFAMVFDGEEQAKFFLRTCGRVVEEWIIEPENE